MPDEFNPIAPLANGLRQINEQANIAAKGMGDSVTQAANSLLTAVASGLPALPGLPGNKGNNPGNPNGGKGIFPTLDQIVPTEMVLALSKVEDVILPQGFPRPSAALAEATGQRPRRPAADRPAPPANDRPAPPANDRPPPAAPRRAHVIQMRGV